MDEELKARTMHLKVFIMWPMNEKGKLHKPSTDAMKLNKTLMHAQAILHFRMFANHMMIAHFVVTNNLRDSAAPLRAQLRKPPSSCSSSRD